MIFDVPFMNLIIVLNKEMIQCMEMFVINNMRNLSVFSSKNGQAWKFLTNIISDRKIINIIFSNRKTYNFQESMVKEQKAAAVCEV